MANKILIDLKDFEKKIYQRNNLVIKTLKIEDIKKKYLESLKDNEINQYLFSKKKKELTKNHVYKYISQNNASSEDVLFGIFFKKKHIGNCRIHFKKKELYIGILIFDKSIQGKGFGTKSLKVVSNFAYKNLNINSIHARIHIENKASLNAFKKAGFKIKGKIVNKCFFIVKKYFF